MGLQSDSLPTIVSDTGVSIAKYLGVNIHDKLSWNTHINQVVKKANNTRAFLQM